jgi:hypothetical protein
MSALFQDVLQFARGLWARLLLPADAAKDSSIDWEDGEGR